MECPYCHGEIEIAIIKENTLPKQEECKCVFNKPFVKNDCPIHGNPKKSEEKMKWWCIHMSWIDWDRDEWDWCITYKTNWAVEGSTTSHRVGSNWDYCPICHAPRPNEKTNRPDATLSEVRLPEKIISNGEIPCCKECDHHITVTNQLIDYLKAKESP